MRPRAVERGRNHEILHSGEVVALQDLEKQAVSAADAAWEDALQQYELYLTSIRTEMPESVQRLLDNFYLHDARVLSIGRQDEALVVNLQLDVPPHELLTITYRLVAEPRINANALPPQHCSTGIQWLHDELEEVREAGRPKHYVHSILLSNGWEVQVHFRDVQLATARPIYPLRSSTFQAQGLAAQSA